MSTAKGEAGDQSSDSSQTTKEPSMPQPVTENPSKLIERGLWWPKRNKRKD